MKLQNSLILREYMRTDMLPTTWCPGCGLGIIMSSLIQAIHFQGLNKDEVSMVSGIGCTGRMSGYTDFNSIHTTHGRAPAFATGLKMAQPNMKIFTIMGDGDAMSIGGNHLISAMRRNIDMVAIVVNNSIYGLTGGQSSPTTPTGSKTTTAKHKTFERPMSLEILAQASDIPFFARATVNHTAALTKLIERATNISGFALIEIISNCHVLYGKMNQRPDAADMIADMDTDTQRSTPMLKRRAIQPLRVTDTAKTISEVISDDTLQGITTEQRESRGIIIEKKGSVDFCRKYYAAIDQIQAQKRDAGDQND